MIMIIDVDLFEQAQALHQQFYLFPGNLHNHLLDLPIFLCKHLTWPCAPCTCIAPLVLFNCILTVLNSVKPSQSFTKCNLANGYHPLTSHLAVSALSIYVCILALPYPVPLPYHRKRFPMLLSLQYWSWMCLGT